ncbi:MAG: tetratricopeptide repeat protein [Gammaproteobacteria bacterium]|nr:MAG: tetratricopeptide repeat protein [Gammaproteobacteria bacterium]
MKFTKPLFAAFIVFIFLQGCGSNPEKPVVDKADGKAATTADDTASAKSKANIPASILPAGPATPNPYLQNPPKLNDQLQLSFNEAVAAMQQKKWDQAEVALKQLAEKNPKLSGLYLNLGIVYRNKGLKDKAADEFNRAISINPKNIEAYNQLAVLKRESGDFSAAENLYQKALAVWPFYPEGHKNIAILYDLYLSKPEQALPHYLAYQQLLTAPDKQVDSWVAELQRRINTGKAN